MKARISNEALARGGAGRAAPALEHVAVVEGGARQIVGHLVVESDPVSLGDTKVLGRQVRVLLVRLDSVKPIQLVSTYGLRAVLPAI